MDEEKVLDFENEDAIKRRSERNGKKKGKQNKWLVLILVIVIAVLGAYIVKSEMKIHDLQKERMAQEAEKERLEREKEELTNELESINTDEYIEYMARKNLNMVKPGEILFVLPEDEDATPTDTKKAKTEDKSKEADNDGANAEEKADD